MKFIISKQEMSNLLNKIQNVVPVKPTVPILSNFLIEAVNDELILTATDLTLGIRLYTKAKILEEGATTLPAKRLVPLLRELTAANIEFSTNENSVTEIISDSSRFKIHGMPKDEYPALPDLSDATQFKLKQSELKEMFYRTSFAVSKEDNRYVLTGVLMHIENSTATFVGTDGKRLARAHLPISLEPSFSGDYIIPLKAVEEIIKNLHEDEDVTVYLMQDKIAVEANNLLMITKLLSGEYPDVARVIPAQSEIKITLHREELMSLLRQVSLFVADMTHSVRFTLMQGDLRIAANNADVGEGKVSMPVNYHGTPLDIAFNPAYFLDILRHSKKETVGLWMIDSFNPGVIVDQELVPSDTSLANPLFVIMPMRLNEEG